eukprot:UN09198
MIGSDSFENTNRIQNEMSNKPFGVNFSDEVNVKLLITIDDTNVEINTNQIENIVKDLKCSVKVVNNFGMIPTNVPSRTPTTSPSTPTVIDPSIIITMTKRVTESIDDTTLTKIF